MNDNVLIDLYAQYQAALDDMTAAAKDFSPEGDSNFELATLEAKELRRQILELEGEEK